MDTYRDEPQGPPAPVNGAPGLPPPMLVNASMSATSRGTPGGRD